MRYAIFSALYEPHLGGVELYSKNLSRNLVDRGDEVRVVTSALERGAEGVAPDEFGFPVMRLPSVSVLDGRLPLVAYNGSWRVAMAELEAWSPERVVVNTRFYPLSLAGVAFGARNSIPTLVVDHGQGFLTLDNRVLDWAIERYERLVARWMARRHPTYAGVSQASARWLENLGIHTSLVVANAIDAEAFRAEATDIDWRARLGVAVDRPLALFAARLTPEKGPRIFRETASLLPDVEFLMVGSGPLDAEMARDDASPNFRYLGRIAHGDLSALMAQSDVFCVPSLQEGLLTTLMEAASWGTPPVTTPIGGSDEVLADRSWGVVLDQRTPEALATGIEEVLSWSPDVRERRRLALATHVRDACRWDETLAALDRAFDDHARTLGDAVSS